MKYIIIVPDGMADYPIAELGHKTPLQAARTTNMDYMAVNGRIGLVKTIPDAFPPGSDIGNLSLMGYNPQECFSGRAPLEAANLGIELAADEVAFRCNLVTIYSHKMVDYSAGHISTKEADQIIATLNERIQEPNIRFMTGKSYRHLMIMKVRNTQDFVKIPCVPPHDILDKDINKHLPSGGQAPMLHKIMEKASRILSDHTVNQVRIDLKENPANAIWLWGQGTQPRMQRFKDKFGVEGAIISAVDLVNGIGRLAGLEVIQVPGATGYYDTNYAGKAEFALKALKTKDFVYIHIEGPDEAGHNGDAAAKVSCIENIDREIVGRVLNHFNKGDDVRIVVLPDHPTPVSLRTHSREPVGFVMYGKGIIPSGAEAFNEETSKEKGLQFESGEALMNYFMRKRLG
jgi:2,3-bisphosphoglycerate-independent phosphoglycerate mutase